MAQGMINWKSCKSIPPGQRLADAVCDFAHRWTIYLSVQCRDQRGHRYTKSVEVAPQGNYLAAHLEDVIEETYKDLVADSNPNHRIASGWIAIPAEISLTEEQAARVFDAVGVWNQQRAESVSLPKSPFIKELESLTPMMPAGSSGRMAI